MGGRRATSLREVLGAVNPGHASSLGRALRDQNPIAVAEASAKLVASSPKPASILFYAAKLARFVAEKLGEAKELSYSERERLVRQEWSRIKRAEGIPNDPVVTNTLVIAATRALKPPGSGRG